MAFYDKIPQPQGLDRQEYVCWDCSKTIGTIFGPFKGCVYTGR